MDFQKLFLSADGRIGRGEFWAGWCILFVVNLVLNLIPGLGHFLALALIYCWVCVYSKRLHDMGKSGWLQVVPMAILFGGAIFAIVAGVGAAISAGAANGSEAAGMAALGGFGVMALVLCLSFVVGIGFLLWVGLATGEPGVNRYGPPPGELASPTPPATVG